MGYELKMDFPGQEDMRAQVVQAEIFAISNKIAENSNEMLRLNKELQKEGLTEEEKYELGFKLAQVAEEGDNLIKRREILFTQNGVEV